MGTEALFCGRGRPPAQATYLLRPQVDAGAQLREGYAPVLLPHLPNVGWLAVAVGRRQALGPRNHKVVVQAAGTRPCCSRRHAGAGSAQALRA
jgi:hypothetical protein